MHQKFLRLPVWKDVAIAVATLVSVGLPAAAHAGFFIPKDNWMAMTTVTPDEINLDLAYGSRNEVVAQLMWAPYAADYEDVASWIGVPGKRVSDERRIEVTP